MPLQGLVPLNRVLMGGAQGQQGLGGGAGGGVQEGAVPR